MFNFKMCEKKGKKFRGKFFWMPKLINQLN